MATKQELRAAVREAEIDLRGAKINVESYHNNASIADRVDRIITGGLRGLEARVRECEKHLERAKIEFADWILENEDDDES
jgi:hypothetical protein